MILDYGSTSSRYADRATVVQEAIGIPVPLLGGKLERTPEIYRFLGAILGTKERAADLAGAAERLLTITRERAYARHEAGPIRVYYARSADGLTTATAASSLGDVLRLIGLVNGRTSQRSRRAGSIWRRPCRFGWIDEPPSVNRLLGLLWMGHTLYPAVYPVDLRAEARDFFRRFYRIELDDEQFEALSQ